MEMFTIIEKWAIFMKKWSFWKAPTREHIIKCTWLSVNESWFRKFFYVFEKSGKQNLYTCRNQVFFFFKFSQEWQKCWKLRHAFLTSTKSYLSTKKEIHSMMPPSLKTRQKTRFLCKDKCVRQKMWLRVFFTII